MYLRKLYEEGFVVGPNEDVETFLNRVSYIKEALKNPKKLIEQIEQLQGEVEVLNHSLILFKSSKKLPFWFGGMTWICELDNGVKIPILQMPKKKRFFWVDIDEVISHEQVHAKRAAFNENKFEEILAYRTSKARWRRFFGPLFSSNRQSFYFLSLASIGCLSPIFPNEWGELLLLPFAIFLLTILTNLFKNQLLFHSALKNLKKEFVFPEKIIELLTDKEIIKYALKKSSTINRSSLRWKQIHLVDT